MRQLYTVNNHQWGVSLRPQGKDISQQHTTTYSSQIALLSLPGDNQEKIQSWYLTTFVWNNGQTHHCKDSCTLPFSCLCLTRSSCSCVRKPYMELVKRETSTVRKKYWGCYIIAAVFGAVSHVIQPHQCPCLRSTLHAFLQN